VPYFRNRNRSIIFPGCISVICFTMLFLCLGETKWYGRMDGLLANIIHNGALECDVFHCFCLRKTVTSSLSILYTDYYANLCILILHKILLLRTDSINMKNSAIVSHVSSPERPRNVFYLCNLSSGPISKCNSIRNVKPKNKYIFCGTTRYFARSITITSKL
jgi:hypothetical protein